VARLFFDQGQKQEAQVAGAEHAAAAKTTAAAASAHTVTVVEPERAAAEATAAPHGHSGHLVVEAIPGVVEKVHGCSPMYRT
jgi:type IV secretory pathway TrbL component